MNFSDLEQTVNRIAYFFKLNVKLINLDNQSNSSNSSASVEEPFSLPERKVLPMYQAKDGGDTSEIQGKFIEKSESDFDMKREYSGDETDEDDEFVQELFGFEDKEVKPLKKSIHKEKSKQIKEELDSLNNEHNKLGDLMTELHSDMNVKNDFSNSHYESPEEIPMKVAPRLSYEDENIEEMDQNSVKNEFSIDQYKLEARNIMND